MKDSLLRLIDDLETKKLKTVEVQKRTLTGIVHSVAEGMIIQSEYVIKELRKVLDDHAKPNDL